VVTNEHSLRASGGFRVSVTGDMVVAKRDLAAFRPSLKKKRSTMLVIASVISGTLCMLELVHQWKVGISFSVVGLIVPITYILRTGLPVGLVFNYLFPRSSSLLIDRKAVQVQRPRFGRDEALVTLTKTDVQGICFVDEGTGLFGFPTHISIQAHGSTIKCLQGIEAEEARHIIGECRRLGYKEC